MKEAEFYDRLARAAFENASELRDEAKLLFDKGRYARTVSLSVMSMEEQVKAIVSLLVSIGQVKSNDLRWRQARGLLRRRKTSKHLFLDHKMKQVMFGYAYLNTKVGREVLEKVKAGETTEMTTPFRSLHGMEDMTKMFQDLEGTRLDSIYVGIKEKSMFAPNRKFNREQAETMLGCATELLALWRWAFANPKEVWVPIFKELSRRTPQVKHPDEPPHQ
jgi:AbiV family abortive infection protein